MKIKYIIIIIIFLAIVSKADSNDNCFDCHSNTEAPYYINQTKYDDNSHDLLECVDCHNSSLDSSDIEHGAFLRTLKGNTVMGSLNFSEYNSSNYQLCYYCHNETRLIGLPSNYSNSLWTHRPSSGFPLNISSISTNFANEREDGYNFGNYPANLHWDHLDMHGINSNKPWDSNRDGILDSMISCTACHEPHGNTSKEVLTRNDLNITFDSDINGSYGMINSSEYLVSGGDVYCNGCHGYGSQYKYYRTYQNLMDSCIGCHVNSIGNVNESVFKQSIHININTSDGIGLLNNSDCWTCHYLKDMDNVLSCVNCHVEGYVLQAPRITQHTPTNYSELKTTVYCTICHINSTNLKQGNPNNPNLNASIAHYGTKALLPDTIGNTNTSQGCVYCHRSSENALKWGNAINLNVVTFPREHVENNNTQCWSCHFDNSSLNSFHNLSLNPGWDPQCKGCHYNFSYMSNKDTNISGYFNATNATYKYINGTMFNQSAHASVSCPKCHTDSNRSQHPPTIGKRKSCESCHGVQNRHNITRQPLENKINGVSVVEIKDCTICHDGTLYNNSIANYNRNADIDCDYCHTYPDKNKENFY